MAAIRSLSAAVLGLAWVGGAAADSTQARCDIYPLGEDHTDVMIPCTFSQRQGYITINRDDAHFSFRKRRGEAGTQGRQETRPALMESLTLH